MIQVRIGSEALEVGRDQLEESKRLRREQTQPYVVVYEEQLATHRYVIDLVIKNLGVTSARDVRVAIAPPPERAWGQGSLPRLLAVPSEIPLLVPGQ